MPKLLFARPAVDVEEERKVRKLAGARHALADWIMRARMIAASFVPANCAPPPSKNLIESANALAFGACLRRSDETAAPSSSSTGRCQRSAVAADRRR